MHLIRIHYSLFYGLLQFHKMITLEIKTRAVNVEIPP